MALDWADGRTARGDGDAAGLTRRARRLALPALALVLVLAAAALAVAAMSSGAAIGGGTSGLAAVSTGFAGGTVQSVVATGPGGRTIPVTLRGSQVWPRVSLVPGEAVSVSVVVRRPGWIGWLAGATTRATVQLRTPTAALAERFLVVAHGAPLVVSFDRPVQALAYGQPGAMRTRALAAPAASVSLPVSAQAGTIALAAVPREWERMPAPSRLTWFPAGAGTSAVASPQPGSQITPASAITLSFSQPVAQALGSRMPALSPATPGSWRTVDAHTIVFHPRGYGFPLAQEVRVQLPAGVSLLGAAGARWSVPAGSPERAREVLAELGYLPLAFTPAGAPVAHSPHAEARAAVRPPGGSFSWRWSGVPAALRQAWAAEPATVTRGALMAFENDHGLTPDGVPGPQVWHALLAAAVAGARAHSGYTFVSVSEASETLSLWHDGGVVLSTPVNTGIASAPTATGVYPTYTHSPSVTMSGTNPDGSHYHDPGVPWISYFNGGDALHGFTRAQYGFPQSLGCVEIPIATAGRVWPYTPIGTLVHIG